MNEQSMKRVNTVGYKVALASVWAALAASGCSQGMTESSELEHEASLQGASELEQIDQALIAGCTALGVDTTRHACTHGTLGPFASRTAKTAATYDTFAATHTYYDVTFTDGTAPYTGRIDYSPSATSDYAIYYNPNLTVTVKDKNGTTVSPLLTKSMTSCSYLGGYRIFPLSSSSSFKPYQITLTSATTTPVKVLLEDLTDASIWWYKDMDGDAWGDSAQKQLTPCIPDEPYTVKQGGDCNEAQAAIYPGATEAMGDGIDSNCNGNDNN